MLNQTEVYSNILDILASFHSQPCMRPEHPAFTEALFAVSCEVRYIWNFIPVSSVSFTSSVWVIRYVGYVYICQVSGGNRGWEYLIRFDTSGEG